MGKKNKIKIIQLQVSYWKQYIKCDSQACKNCDWVGEWERYQNTITMKDKVNEETTFLQPKNKKAPTTARSIRKFKYSVNKLTKEKSSNQASANKVTVQRQDELGSLLSCWYMLSFALGRSSVVISTMWIQQLCWIRPAIYLVQQHVRQQSHQLFQGNCHHH